MILKLRFGSLFWYRSHEPASTCTLWKAGLKKYNFSYLSHCFSPDWEKLKIWNMNFCITIMCKDIIMLLVGLDTSEILSRTQKIQILKNCFHNTISHCACLPSIIYCSLKLLSFKLEIDLLHNLRNCWQMNKTWNSTIILTKDSSFLEFLWVRSKAPI